MRDFPSIDNEAEAAAMQTVFFTDGEFEGRPYRASRANYLAFLSLRGSEINGEIEKLRALFAEYPVALLEQDVICLLTARNWRVHNIACVVLAAGFITDRSLRRCGRASVPEAGPLHSWWQLRPMWIPATSRRLVSY